MKNLFTKRHFKAIADYLVSLYYADYDRAMDYDEEYSAMVSFLSTQPNFNQEKFDKYLEQQQALEQ